jgi:hypothetical protein
MLRSISHASRNSVEIYVSEPRDRLLDLSVSQPDAEGPIYGTHGARAADRDAELTGESLYDARAIG